MRSVLVHACLWKVVSGESVKPEVDTGGAWQSQDEKALATIILSVKSSQLGYVKGCLTAAEAWKVLQDVHQPKGPLRTVMLYKKLLSKRLLEGQSISSHIKEFKEIFDALDAVEIGITEKLRSVVLLSSLPESFENFVVAIETRDELPLFDALCIKLIEEDTRRGGAEQQREKQTESAKAFTAVHKPQAPAREARPSAKKRKDVVCYNCGERGHFKANCRREKVNKESATQKQCSLLNALDGGGFGKTQWCLDSGATSHMCCDRSVFTEYEEHTEKISLAGNGFLLAKGIGTVKLKTDLCTLVLNNVLFVPDLNGNFMSVSRAAQYKCFVNFGPHYADVIQEGERILRVMRAGNLYMFQGKHNSCFAAVDADGSLWHKRYGHLNTSSLQEMVRKKMVYGVEKVVFKPDAVCKTCMLAKIHVQPFPKITRSRAEELLDMIHSDLCGPFSTPSLAGSKYFLTFIDDKSRRIFVYFLRKKDEVFTKFVEFKKLVERQTGRKIKCIRSDNGGEFVNNVFDDYLKAHGIARQLTIPHTPQQNGVAERANRTLVEMARCMLLQSELGEALWAEAINTAVYLRNRSTSRALQSKTPMEEWTGKIPAVSHLRVFGAIAVALDKGVHKGKFESKGKEYRMIGYSIAAKGYRLFDKEKRCVIEKRDVLFDESGSLVNHGNTIEFQFPATDDPEPQSDSNAREGDDTEPVGSSDDYESAAEAEEAEVHVGPGRPKIVRTGRPGRPKKQYNVLGVLMASDVEIPKSYEEAINSQYSAKWEEAMGLEYKALLANETWKLADLPRNRRCVACKWVYSLKRDVSGRIERFKARLVAKGCSQKFGVDYFETFSPVCRLESVRLILALAAEMQLYLHHMDVCTAYLNSELKDTVYMKQPQGFTDAANPDQVLLLRKAIYGLKQSGREWNSKLDGVLKDLGFKACNHEPCLYQQSGQGNLMLILVYVDDLILACQSREDMEDLKAKISESFECTDKGPLHLFLGMEVQRDGDLGEITLGHSQYIKELLRAYGSENCRPATTPLDAGHQVLCAGEQCQKVDAGQYQSTIGELMWLGLTTRPDILHSVAKLAQRNKDPHSEHMVAVKHILRYLASTVDVKLHYQKCGQAFTGFVDADWGGDRLDRKSYTGYVFFLSGGPVSWRSEKQQSVALSSTEAEYMALTTACKEAIALRRLIVEIGCGDLKTPTVMHGDNLSAQHLAKNPVHHSRTKHIDIRYHFIREVMKEGHVVLEYTSTNEMIADIMTKNLSKGKHNGFMKMLNLF